MEQILVINGRLPSRNEEILQNRKNIYAGAKLKRDANNKVAWHVKEQRITSFEGPVTLEVVFYEPNYRRDFDNVIGALKYVLDGLVKSNIIKNDTRKIISDVKMSVLVDKTNPRIEIKIKE